jgi:hypothetical protein
VRAVVRWLAERDKDFLADLGPEPPTFYPNEEHSDEDFLPDIYVGEKQIRIYVPPDKSTVSRWGRIHRGFAG